MQTKNLSRRQFLKMTAAGIGSTAFLAACVPAVPEQSSAANVESEAPQAETAEVNVAQVWEAAFRPHQEDFDNTFMEQNPEIVIKRTYNSWADHNEVVPAWAAAGTLPDIIYVHGSRAFPWAKEGILISLQAYIDADKEFEVEGIWEEALKLYRVDGKQTAIPYDHGPKILGYNKDIFDAAGLDYPNDDWTMDDLLTAAQTLTDPDNNIFGWSGTLPAVNHETVLPWGGEVMDEAHTQILVDSAESQAAFQFWVDMIHEHKVAPTPAESEAFEQGPWISGNAAMAVVASWNTPTLDKFASFAWDVTNWPAGPAGRGCGSFGSGFGITKDSKSPDKSWTYMSSYLSREGMEFVWGHTGRGSPARKAAYDSWMNSDIAPANAQAFLQALDEYAVTDRPFATAAAAEINDIFNREVALMRSSDKSVADAVAAMVTDGQAALDKAS